MNPVLSLHNISKSYKTVQALQNISFDVPEGCVFGILGPNGSGKTTLLGIVLDILKADNGFYSWLGGAAPHDARKQIGSLLETPNFYHYLSAVDNLKINAAIKKKGHDDIDKVLEKLNLHQRKHSKFQTYSLGMKQRLAIAAALLGNPKVLVLDEPTNGLDPAGIAEIRNRIIKLNQEGITIIMASHLLDEVEKVCSHVAILKQGKLMLSGKVDEVLVNEDIVLLKAEDIKAVEIVLKTMPGVVRTNLSDGFLQVYIDHQTSPKQINEKCIAQGIVLTHLQLKKKSLEF